MRGRVENGGQHRVWASWNDARRHALRAWRRILRQRDRVQLSAPGVPLAMLIMGAYYGLFLAGDLLTRIAPDLAQRHFRI